jgi:hypothetical protein
MLFSDHLYDDDTGIVTFDTFNFDGVLGDRFLVNGKVQPVMPVHPRRYRFRWLDAGPGFREPTTLIRILRNLCVNSLRLCGLSLTEILLQLSAHKKNLNHVGETN